MGRTTVQVIDTSGHLMQLPAHDDLDLDSSRDGKSVPSEASNSHPGVWGLSSRGCGAAKWVQGDHVKAVRARIQASLTVPGQALHQTGAGGKKHFSTVAEAEAFIDSLPPVKKWGTLFHRRRGHSHILSFFLLFSFLLFLRAGGDDCGVVKIVYTMVPKYFVCVCVCVCLVVSSVPVSMS